MGCDLRAQHVGGISRRGGASARLAADCFLARDCGPSVSMVITGRPRHYCVSPSQSICYKLVCLKIIN